MGEMWSKQSPKDKQPYEQKEAKLKKYEKDIAAYHAKGKSEAGKKGPGRPTGSKKNKPEDEEEEEEEEDFWPRWRLRYSHCASSHNQKKNNNKFKNKKQPLTDRKSNCMEVPQPRS